MAETNYISSIKTPKGKTYNIKDTDARKRMTEITWSSLVSLRNSKQLIPGMQYRITDYHTTTSQAPSPLGEDTKSANHQFDIIVTADSINKLNESARAIQHNGDTYFSNCNLAAWKIWYCLDNDTKRFAWAGSTNGKGVIYRMIDEHNNDCPYDFKNIQFIRYYSASAETNYGYAYVYWYKSKYDFAGIKDLDATKSKYFYTFSYDDGNSIIDASLNSNVSLYHSEGNTIDNEYVAAIIDDTSYSIIMSLNNIVIISSSTSMADQDYQKSCIHNKFDKGCRNCTLVDCSNNTFGINCSDIILGQLCDKNTFSMNCFKIFIQTDSIGNIFGEHCSYIHFSQYSMNSIFDNNCYRISCGGFIDSNIRGYNISDSTTNKVYYNVTILGSSYGYENESIDDLSKYLKSDVCYPQFIGSNSSGTIVSYTLDSIINNS